jgi:hypothetical protein
MIASFKAHLDLVFFDGATLTPVPPVHLRPNLSARSTWLGEASQPLPGWGRPDECEFRRATRAMAGSSAHYQVMISDAQLTGEGHRP